MKKNNMMRIASVLLVAVLLSTCVISGTYAKYTSTVTTSDSARVAYWGFNSTTTEISLFEYEDAGVVNTDGVVTGLVAPGTTGKTTLNMAYTNGTDGENEITAPEVDYKLTVTAKVTCDEALAGVLTWKFNGEKIAVGEIADAIEEASSEKIEAGNLPELFETGVELEWAWAIDGNDEVDTALGNADELGTVTVAITIVAEQIN